VSAIQELAAPEDIEPLTLEVLEQGVSVHTFRDERDLLWHSLVFSAADRESAYVTDGLMPPLTTRLHQFGSQAQPHITSLGVL